MSGPLEIGQVVFSKKGRDAGKAFMITALDAPDYVYLADGRLRKVERPKRKKVKHIIPTQELITNLGERIKSGKSIADGDLLLALEALGYHVDALKEE